MLFLVGPTAVGKSAIALELARLLNGEIVVADSMQVYRDLDIATAKPTRQEQSFVPHHMLDLVEPFISFSVADWLNRAQKIIPDIEQRHKIPLIVGGTGLYIRALRQGLATNPATPPSLRTELSQLSLEDLIERLTKLDSQMIKQIDLKNRRRIERTIAILELGGTAKPNTWGKNLANPSPIYGLTRSREDLTLRINERVEIMLKQGLEEEYIKFVENGLPPTATAWQAIGYRQFQAYRSGEITYTECVNRIKIETRHYAKRQLTWFKRDKDVQWISLSSDQSPAMTAQQIYRDYLKNKS